MSYHCYKCNKDVDVFMNISTGEQTCTFCKTGFVIKNEVKEPVPSGYENLYKAPQQSGQYPTTAPEYAKSGSGQQDHSRRVQENVYPTRNAYYPPPGSDQRNVSPNRVYSNPNQYNQPNVSPYGYGNPYDQSRGAPIHNPYFVQSNSPSHFGSQGSTSYGPQMNENVSIDQMGNRVFPTRRINYAQPETPYNPYLQPHMWKGQQSQPQYQNYHNPYMNQQPNYNQQPPPYTHHFQSATPNAPPPENSVRVSPPVLNIEPKVEKIPVKVPSGSTLYPTTHDLPSNMPINLYHIDSIPSVSGCGDLFPDEVPKQPQPTEARPGLFGSFFQSLQHISSQVGTVTSNVIDGVEGIIDDVSYRIVPHQQKFQGTPPASKDAIDECPIIKIEQKHIDLDPQCAICMGKWKVGEDAKELPCVHLFHEDCITPWLKMHNSCPICRYELKTTSSTYERYKRHKMKLMGVTEIVPPRKQQQDEESEDINDDLADINIDISLPNPPPKRTDIIENTLKSSRNIYNTREPIIPIIENTFPEEDELSDIDKLLEQRLKNLQLNNH